jgi:uncharacterized OsmC-like protein
MDVNSVSVEYIGNEQARVESGGRTFIVDRRTKAAQAGARFCPIELIATSLGA